MFNNEKLYRFLSRLRNYCKVIKKRFLTIFVHTCRATHFYSNVPLFYRKIYIEKSLAIFRMYFRSRDVFAQRARGKCQKRLLSRVLSPQIFPPRLHVIARVFHQEYTADSAKGALRVITFLEFPWLIQIPRSFVDVVMQRVHLHNAGNTMCNTRVGTSVILERGRPGNEIAHCAARNDGPEASRRLPFAITT